MCGTCEGGEIDRLACREQSESAGCFLHSLPNRRDNRRFIGELAGLELRVNQLTIHGQLETSATTRDELEVGDLLFVFSEQLLRQTDGLRLIVSHRAVFEFQVHTCPLESNAKSPISL